MPDAMTLADAYPKEQARVRRVLEHYQEAQRTMGPRVNCHFAIASIKQSLERAEKAAAEQDVVAMLECYQDLTEIK
jgi:hypothetical protein